MNLVYRICTGRNGTSLPTTKLEDVALLQAVSYMPGLKTTTLKFQTIAHVVGKSSEPIITRII
jgi:hypothetical protein